MVPVKTPSSWVDMFVIMIDSVGFSATTRGGTRSQTGTTAYNVSSSVSLPLASAAVPLTDTDKLQFCGSNTSRDTSTSGAVASNSATDNSEIVNTPNSSSYTLELAFTTLNRGACAWFHCVSRTVSTIDVDNS
ncbi:hypothetical protein GN244_ATG02304 [Phytophthora infestans]|uniref:Uncharacterized protein n=1 Tax=Phytophthora infestans TaxID=4787 RepID=A0A833SSP6_PHYIN|nr:hypothetical protein GN244_ATG02304 [Phytophthora infestans]